MNTTRIPQISGYIDPNFPDPHGPHDAPIVIYGYVPNFVLCILGIALFALATIVHGTQILLLRTWYFLPLTFACIMEVIGYISRALSSRDDPYSIIYFVIYYSFIVVAPVFISASIYICLTKLIAWVENEGLQLHSRILRKKFILWTFITADIICTAVQIAGAAYTGNRESEDKDPRVANSILLAGLAIQSSFFLLYLGILNFFVITVWRDPNFKTPFRKIRTFMGALGVSSLLVFLRTIFRVAETSQGVSGYLSSHEAFFGALEFAPMILAVAILAVWHPGNKFVCL